MASTNSLKSNISVSAGSDPQRLHPNRKQIHRADRTRSGFSLARDRILESGKRLFIDADSLVMYSSHSKLKIANREFEPRLLLGTGKFASNSLMKRALEASGTQIVTVALRRVDVSGGHDPFADILDSIDVDRYLLLPNTSGAIPRTKRSG